MLARFIFINKGEQLISEVFNVLYFIINLGSVEALIDKHRRVFFVGQISIAWLV